MIACRRVLVAFDRVKYISVLSQRQALLLRNPACLGGRLSVIGTLLQLDVSALHVPAGDAIRPFLLHAYGGLYMDVDVECFDATDDMVDGFDLVSMHGQPQGSRHTTSYTCHQPTAPTILLGVSIGGLSVMPLLSCM